MKRSMLAVTIAATTATVSVGVGAFSMFSSFTEYMYSFTQSRQFNMFQVGADGGTSVQYQSTEQEYQYMRQEIMMANLTNYVAYAAPAFGTEPAVGSGEDPAESGCVNTNPFAPECDAEIATDPETGTTVAEYPNGNALYMQGGQVYYEFQYQKVQFSSIEYTMNNFCACMPAIVGQDHSGTFTQYRQMGYSYESLYQMYHQVSFQMGFMSMPGFRSAKGPVLKPVDEVTDAMLEQAKQAVNL